MTAADDLDNLADTTTYMWHLLADKNGIEHDAIDRVADQLANAVSTSTCALTGVRSDGGSWIGSVAHRLAYQLLGPDTIADDDQLIPRCGNRRCWRPDHMDVLRPPTLLEGTR